MADRVGREKTKWCSGCHDPVVLFTGQMGKATMATFSYDQFEAQQGLTCMSCHSIAEVKDLRGNGGYVIEESKQYPFAFSKNKALQEVNKLLIRMEPSLHRQTFMKPFMRTPEFCSTCHKVGLLPPLNDYHWMRGQNHYDGWYDSGVSGNAVRSFYDPPKPKACRDCHLPLIASESSVTWPGSCTTTSSRRRTRRCRRSAGTKQTIEDIRRKILVGSLSIDLFALKRGSEVIPLGPTLPSVRPGETVDVEVVVRTRTLGHPYTNGTSDSNETWVEFHAADGARRSWTPARWTPRAPRSRGGQDLPARHRARRLAPWTAASRRTSTSRSSTTSSRPARRAPSTTASPCPKDAKGTITFRRPQLPQVLPRLLDLRRREKAPELPSRASRRIP